MKSIALRFSEKFSPASGTIREHEKLIEQYGFVWYGKMGTAVSPGYIAEVLNNEEPRILLIHSGGIDRYWAYITEASSIQPERQYIPEYYRSMADKFHFWFKIVKITKADRDIMSRCIVSSSKSTLSNASKYSMSPYFKIDVPE